MAGKLGSAVELEPDEHSARIFLGVIPGLAGKFSRKSWQTELQTAFCVCAEYLISGHIILSVQRIFCNIKEDHVVLCAAEFPLALNGERDAAKASMRNGHGSGLDVLYSDKSGIVKSHGESYDGVTLRVGIFGNGNISVHCIVKLGSDLSVKLQGHSADLGILAVRDLSCRA